VSPVPKEAWSINEGSGAGTGKVTPDRQVAEGPAVLPGWTRPVAGTQVALTATVGDRRGRLTMLNPVYELLSVPETEAAPPD
jgi:hypothetical protein